jgi:hypothetical protein
MALFYPFHPLGSDLKLVAWRLMNTSGQAHLTRLINRLPLCDLILEPFIATEADKPTPSATTLPSGVRKEQAL